MQRIWQQHKQLDSLHLSWRAGSALSGQCSSSQSSSSPILWCPGAESGPVNMFSQMLSNSSEKQEYQMVTRVGLDFVTIPNRILKLNFKFLIWIKVAQQNRVTLSPSSFELYILWTHTLDLDLDCDNLCDIPLICFEFDNHSIKYSGLLLSRGLLFCSLSVLTNYLYISSLELLDCTVVTGLKLWNIFLAVTALEVQMLVCVCVSVSVTLATTVLDFWRTPKGLLKNFGL